MLIGVYKMSGIALKCVLIERPHAAASAAVLGLQYAQLIAVFIYYSAYSRGEVGAVRLELTLPQRRNKASAGGKLIINGVGLIAVGDDDGAAEPPDRGIDYKARVGTLLFVKRPCAYAVVRPLEDAVAAVLAPAHDEIGYHRRTAVMPKQYAPAGILIFG